jgi:AcrR family transcriptional regulator
VQEPQSEPVRRLPPGPHGIPRELVARNQRERLIAAMAEVSAQRGYGSTSVTDVARHAGVSTASFYRQFKDKRECMLVSFEELFGRLLGEVERACRAEAEPADRAKAGVRTAAALLAGDPPTARLLAVEIAAVGAEGVRLQHEAIEQLAGRLRGGREAGGATAERPPSAEWAAVAAMVSLVAKRAAEGESADPAELEILAARL